MQIPRRVGTLIDRGGREARRSWVLRTLGERATDLRHEEEWEGFKN